MSVQQVVQWQEDIEANVAEPSLRRIAWLAILTIVLGFGGLVGWAAIARIDSAVPASGVIVAAGKRKTVSLLDSGILKSLLVQEGDRVSAGQILLRLDDVQARAAADQAFAQFWGAAARAARLRAEALDERTLTLPLDLTGEAGNPAIAPLIAGEQHLFAARWEAYDGALGIIGKRIGQQNALIAALDSQITEHSRRIGTYEEELRGVEYLLARGFATKTRAFELRRNAAELRGQQFDLAGRRAEARQLIGQTELEIIATGNNRRSDINKERSDLEAVLADSAQRLRAARDLLSKRDITAPEDGTVTDIHFFTPGSSIGAGQPILDIVPAGEHLLVEGAVSPMDIEHVLAGQAVNVRLTAYKAHQVPVLTGRLVYVAADRQNDAHNEPMFLVRAELDPDALKNYPGVTLTSGMPADVLIISGERSVLDFLIAPIRDHVRHAMKEQ